MIQFEFQYFLYFKNRKKINYINDTKIIMLHNNNNNNNNNNINKVITNCLNNKKF